MKRPNFFIIGAPKCGTTALYKYLREHPNIFMSSIKEPYYFAFDLPRGDIYKLEDYLSLFSGACSMQHKAVGEATPQYMVSKCAVPEILNFNPEAKFIAMLRNPIDIVYSLYYDRLSWLTENESFEEAWRAELKRKRGKQVSFLFSEKRLPMYSEFGMLGQQMERLYSEVQKERVKVIIFDDFLKNTSGVYESVLSFLGVSSDGRTAFPKINENRVLKWRLLRQTLRLASFVWWPLKIRLGLINKGFGIYTKVEKMNSKNVKRPQISEDLRNELGDYFYEDVVKLSKLVNRDLTHWVAKSSSS